MNHQHPQDHEIAQWLLKVGKTIECTCSFEVEHGPLGRVDYLLVDDHCCPVHFPETSKILGGRP